MSELRFWCSWLEGNWTTLWNSLIDVRERNFTILRPIDLRNEMTLMGIREDDSMARNFGVPRQIDRQKRTPVWRMWLVALLGFINASTFLHR